MVLNKKIKSEKGQMMVEAMVALSLINISLLGVFVLLSNSIGTNREIADKYVAIGLATEGIEIVKNIVDKNALDSTVTWNGGIIGANMETEIILDYTTGLGNGGFDIDVYEGQPLNYDTVNKRYSYDSGGEPTKYRRWVFMEMDVTTTVEPYRDDYLRVVSIVEYDIRGGGKNRIVLEDHLFGWREVTLGP